MTMAGPFDFLNSDDPMLGLSLLAAAGPSAVPQSPFQRIYGGLLGFQQQKQAQEDRAMKKRFMDAQIGNFESEAEARKLKGVQDQRLQDTLAQIFGGPQSPEAALAQGAAQGDFGPTRTNAARMADAHAGMPVAQGAPRGLAGLTPDKIAYLKARGGPDLTDVFKLTQPNWQNIGGNLVNTNAPGFTGGFQPQLNVSSNGQATLSRPGPDGMPVVSAPEGALGTYGAYQDAEQRAKARYTTSTITPAGQPPQLVTGEALADTLNGTRAPQPLIGRLPAAQQPAAGPNAGARVAPVTQNARDDDRMAILQQEQTKTQAAYDAAVRAGDYAGAARAKGDLDSLAREMRGTGARIGMPLQSKADELRETEAIKNEAERTKADAGKAKSASDMLGNLQRARELLGQGPTASTVGSWADRGMSAFGMSTAGAETASALEAIAGWLTANVPRMEGPQSNIDVQNYQVMAGKVGDRTLPVKQRLTALNEVERLNQKYAGTGGATGEFSAGEKPAAQQSFSMLPAARSFSGRRVRGPDGTIYRSNGTTWVKE